MAKRNLNAAKVAKKDEFYTQLSDIERELQHYWQHFRGKVVLCNCDDPYESNFFKYFALRFNQLGLKKLICTCYNGSPVTGNELAFHFDGFDDDEPKKIAYKVEITEVKDENGDGAVDLSDVQYLLKSDRNVLSILKTGDFRSQECIELLKEADIVVTNPPFSLFREYIGQLMEYQKKFLIIGNMNSITCKEIFPYVQNNKMWIGPSISSGDRKFYVPDDYPLNAAGCGVDSDGKRFIRVKGVRWFTNLDHNKRHEDLDLVCRYSEDEYPTFDNFDAIEVGKTSDIPYDYDGIMGVPITFLDKYNPDQFEILGLTQIGCHDLCPDTKRYNDYKEITRATDKPTGSSGGKTNENAVLCGQGNKKTYYLGPNGEVVHSAYKRIFIRKIEKKGTC
ncbi:adenine-specific methyltransferase EcoRI family protein [Segatella copri]|uniref:adenine-specific methyltransferase EcoRI family protein n=1 Tax=Segatella copri TaxID=165179 RepID=UPI001C38146C|nr:adenine-specific methyltransferase EcoRI family protein [Segatella copri]MBV3401659.1 adenine-specific methyltransferase EcoRI family protein [Segatella copri]MBW0048874.1 adenine-specific methyltransferase EcoRI family protein [Segatella copri]